MDPPIVAPDGSIFKQIVVREPSFDEYLRLGDPYTIGFSPGSGIPFVVEDKEAMLAYCRLLVTEPANPMLVELGGFQAARRIKDTVKSFFQPGGTASAAASETSETNSPSTADKA
jgi:hypothetical protein